MTVKLRPTMVFTSWRMAVPILTAFAESDGAKANGFATMRRGALATVCDVRALRGMPWAAKGADNIPADRAITTGRSRYIPLVSPTGQPSRARTKPARHAGT